jgi:hypothetical protein
MTINNRVVVRWLVICTAAAATAIGVVFLSYRTSTVLVENQSDVSVSEIRVELGGETFWSGALAPGESHREFGFAKPDDLGSLVVSFSAKGARHERDFPSGFTSGGSHHRLKITPTLEVEELWMK